MPAEIPEKYFVIYLATYLNIYFRQESHRSYPSLQNMFNVGSTGTTEMCKTCRKLIIKTAQQCQCSCSQYCVVFSVNFEQIRFQFLFLLMIVTIESIEEKRATRLNIYYLGKSTAYCQPFLSVLSWQSMHQSFIHLQLEEGKWK